MMGPGKLTIITVTFWLDRGALWLQARSLRRFLDPEMLEEFIIVVSDNDSRMLQFVQTTISAELGSLAERVRMRSPGDYGCRLQSPSGWRLQQALKLAAVAAASTPVTLILDSKNHLVRPLTTSDLFTTTGKLRSWTAVHWGHMQRFFEASFAYMGVPFRPYIGTSLPTITPFLASRCTVRRLIEDIEKTEGEDLFSFFLRPDNDVTEFFLIMAFLIKEHGSVQYEYDLGRPLGVTVFVNNVENDELESLTEPVRLGLVPFFAMHWSVIPKMTDKQRRLLTDLWEEAGLVAAHEADTVFESCGHLGPGAHYTPMPTAEKI
jgi:hypothetical protein